MAKRKYQYAEGIAAVCKSGGECPPASATEQATEAWRFVRNPITDECFAPVAIKNPKRLIDSKSPEQKCSCWALSMFNTRANAEKRFAALELNFRNIRKALGDHIASGTLDATCGRSTPTDVNGHFDLHPYTDAPLVKIFSIKGPLP